MPNFSCQWVCSEKLMHFRFKHRKQPKIVSVQDLSVPDLPQVEERERESSWEGTGLPSGHSSGEEEEKIQRKKQLSEACYNPEVLAVLPPLTVLSPKKSSLQPLSLPSCQETSGLQQESWVPPCCSQTRVSTATAFLCQISE